MHPGAQELKHGRVAMMASVGLLGQHWLRFPGFDAAPSGLGALNSAEGVAGSVLMLLPVTAIMELAWREDASREPGNFGDPFGVKMYNDEMRNKDQRAGTRAILAVTYLLLALLLFPFFEGPRLVTEGVAPSYNRWGAAGGGRWGAREGL